MEDKPDMTFATNVFVVLAIVFLLTFLLSSDEEVQVLAGLLFVLFVSLAVVSRTHEFSKEKDKYESKDNEK